MIDTQDDIMSKIEEDSQFNKQYIHQSKRIWKKLLYIKQDFPDNYVDDSFLESMEKNVNVKPIDFWRTVYKACIISQYFCSVVILTSLFCALYTKKINRLDLLYSYLILIFSGYIIYDFLNIYSLSNRWVIRKRILFGACVVLLSFSCSTPILASLTKDISSDTIWALSTMAFLIAITCHDYHLKDSPDETIRSVDSLSINAGTIGSVLLASRLNTFFDSFNLLLVSVVVFVLLPVFCKNINFQHMILSIGMISFLHISSTISLFYIGASLDFILLYILFEIFLVFICPLWLLFAQQYKSEIRGPWDEARLAINVDK